MAAVRDIYAHYVLHALGTFEERAAFLQAPADELGRHPTLGPGLVHRVAVDLQRRYVVEARAETAGNEPRHLARSANAR